MEHRIAKHFVGFTTEGHPFQLVAFFEIGPDTPVQFLGSYSSSDGGGRFDVRDERDIPWVVYEGDWHVR
jgi:hypothetical protein